MRFHHGLERSPATFDAFGTISRTPFLAHHFSHTISRTRFLSHISQGLLVLSRRAEALTEFAASHCDGISDEGVRQLSKMRGLLHLSLASCENVSRSAAIDFKSALPSCVLYQ